ncbi:MAG: hypothetical protein IPF56_12050 [Chloroflexi bacterium]|nr:hypothetical protein [Chloroflexota bacterium]
MPSRLDERVPIANRYFGAFVDGRLKTRGIAARRHDTAPFVAETQLAILQRLAAVPDGQPLASALPDVLALLRQRAHALRGGRIPAAQLLVSQRLSRTLDEYRTPSPAARAAGQLVAVGKERRPGQRIRFVYTRGEPGVCLGFAGSGVGNGRHRRTPLPGFARPRRPRHPSTAGR